MDECNGLTIGDFTFDVFITDKGDLGFTVYPAGAVVTDDTQCTDIYVDKGTLEVIDH